MKIEIAYGKKKGNSQGGKNGKNGSRHDRNRAAALRRGIKGEIPEIPMDDEIEPLGGLPSELDEIADPLISPEAPPLVEEMQSLANSWQPETPEGRQYKIDLEVLIDQFGGPSMGGQL